MPQLYQYGPYSTPAGVQLQCIVEYSAAHFQHLAISFTALAVSCYWGELP